MPQELISILMKPFLNKIKSYIRDNIHTTKIDSDTLIITFDVTKLYRNICHEFGK